MPRPIAVLALLLASLSMQALGAQHQASLDERVDAALDRARPALEHHLRTEQNSRLALVCLAAVHDRLPAGDHALAAALDSLVRAPISDTYGLSLRLMVAAHVEDLPDRDELARRDTAALLQHQIDEGGFGYTPAPTSWDMSNTQYAALGLRAAVYLGATVPEDAWRRLGDAVRDQQNDSGGFGYSGGRSTPTVSMTEAGVAVLEICRRQLQLDEGDERRYARSIEAGWRWLRHQNAHLFDLNGWTALYAFYGLERAAVLSGIDEVGGVDWFADGAEILLRLQEKRGGFANTRKLRGGRRPPPNGDAIDTAFAILFLRRSFQAELRPRGPITPGPSRGCRELTADADDIQFRAAVGYDVARGRKAVPDLLATMRMGHERARRAAALALMRISGQDFGYHPARDADENGPALHRAERWWLGVRDEVPGRADGR